MAELSDETLMAYADGELSRDERDRVELILAERPELRDKVRRFERTRVSIQSAYDDILDAPLPPSLVAGIRGQSATTSGVETVTDFAAARQARRSGGGSTATATATAGAGGRPAVGWLPTAIAASLCLVLGGAAGWYGRALQPASPAGAASVTAAAAIWPVQVALETVPSGIEVGLPGSAEGALKIRPALTFKAKDSRFCRQYEVAGGVRAEQEGVACRDGSGVWRVLAEREVVRTAAGGIKPAGAGEPGATIDRLIDGGTLDPAEEKDLLSRHWK